ncbi:MAG TPA: hypothetical protein VE944_18115 [Nostoc sp.]|uniref:hypothetical protein n=1 Tax=Nostoc sp. TaxID=1180 RepID=UPI002D4DA51A|nr:hypothetical protein [Nostoc sp.]HYX16243.1 hypothetical protein [Nostoc sp.]
MDGYFAATVVDTPLENYVKRWTRKKEVGTSWLIQIACVVCPLVQVRHHPGQ